MKNFDLKIYLSWWIANLGVVPLLLFAFFLLRPAFTFLRALLFLVTRVFETISLLLQQIQLCELSRIKYLPILISSVKIFALSSPAVFAEALKSTKNQSLTMSIGEIREVSLKDMRKYSLSNNDPVSHKFLSDTKTLLIKGKKLGITELHIWERNKVKRTLEVFVLSKQRIIKLRALSRDLKSLGLEAYINGNSLSVEGELSELEDYKKFISINKKYENDVEQNVSLSEPLRKKLLARVIKTLFDDHISDFRCVLNRIQIQCFVSDLRMPSSGIKTKLKKELQVHFIKESSHHKKQNYWLKVKIIQLESMDSGAYSFGLHQLSGDIKGYFERGWKSLYEQNKLTLKENGIEADLLAEPTVLVRPNKDVSIQVGAEIPYTSSTKEGVQNTNFRFAGLKLKVKLSPEGDGFLMDYSAEITKPGSGGEISGNKESSSARISIGEPVQLFEVSFQSTSLQKESLPPFGSLGIIGKLFSNNDKKKVYKKITGIVMLEER